MVSPDLSGENLRQLERQAVGVMRELAQVGLSFFKTALAAERKADGSLVSEADRQIEKLARDRLAALTPQFGFVGEEYGQVSRLADGAQVKGPAVEAQNTSVAGLNHFERELNQRPDTLLNLDADTYWILDPIDGTINFLSKVPLWSTLLALVHRGRPVLGLVALPALNEVFVASTGNGSRYAPLFVDEKSGDAIVWQPCVVGRANQLSDALISYSTPKTFAYRGIESFIPVLHQNSRECRTHSDAYGYTRVLKGGVDLMVDPLVAPYDVAALQVLFDETPGARFTTLQGHSGDSRFRKGSVVAGAHAQLVDQFLKLYREHLLAESELSQKQTSLLIEPIIPERFQPTWALNFESEANQQPAKIWARALETAVAKFLLKHPEAEVEDVSLLLSTEESAFRAFSNGRNEGPPRFYASTTFHVRAIVGGAAGLATGNPGFGFNPLEPISAALESAWAQVKANPYDQFGELLAARDQLIAHVGQHAWRTVQFSSDFQSVSTLIQNFHVAQQDKRIHALKSRLNMSVEYRWQYFMDSAQQTFVTQVCRVSSSATCAENSEKRTAYSRYLRNHIPLQEKLSTDLGVHFKKVQQQSLDLLPAVLVPEAPQYDFLAVDADLLGLILHEAVGHAAEGDLIQTGASGFGHNGEMRDLEIGPDWLDIFIDGALDNCGYLPIDAEGVLPRRKTLVYSGRLVDAIHTRHTAKRAGKSPDGCARTQSLQYPSLNRMTSIWVRPAKAKSIEGDLSGHEFDDLPAGLIQKTLEKNGYLDGPHGVLLLNGWKGGTASCSNLEFRADVARVIHLRKGVAPTLMREANFTGIATECFRSAVDAFGPTLCRSIGTCGKDGQGVLTSDGGPAFMVFSPNPKVRVIGTGESEA